MIVTYTGHDEVIVTTEADEQQMLAEYFTEDSGRDLVMYDRDEARPNAKYEVVVICHRPLHVDFE